MKLIYIINKRKLLILFFVNFILILANIYLSKAYYNNFIFVLHNINNRINDEFKIYIECLKISEDLLCGRNNTNYKNPVVKYKQHKSYLPYSMIILCNMYKKIECSNTIILIGILTRPECLYERMMMRRILNIKDIKYIFITGNSTSLNTCYWLKKESEFFNDIIVFNVTSSYYNCSIIMSCFYIYIYNNCINLKWILKLDIDTYFNINLIFNITTKCNEKISVIGSINKNPKLKCTSNSKWSIKCKNNSQLNNKIPPYPFGPAFLFKSSSVKCIYSYFNNTKYYIWIEDIMFGMIMKYCKLEYLDISELTEITYKPKNNLSKLRNKVFVHGLNPIEILLNTKFQIKRE